MSGIKEEIGYTNAYKEDEDLHRELNIQKIWTSAESYGMLDNVTETNENLNEPVNVSTQFKSNMWGRG